MEGEGDTVGPETRVAPDTGEGKNSGLGSAGRPGGALQLTPARRIIGTRMYRI